ncbi:hypothetical protein CHU_1972 [Sporocytophaga myxococcoides]|uniref:DUF4625 domain-containing protein n=1 Tax=Sporocytophaga myxococcoides TaxID=153721 RepID=A0A098LDB7_9BACT|nr:hypothetical protein [Sporocytophaga myxococcoides]GAL84915.1 hypothetical protein CHU_1972 [Sporocytophaga myxococcoides]
MKAYFKHTIPVLFVIGLLFACDRAPNYSEVPVISFNKIQKFNIYNPLSSTFIDSLSISINFQDGDGNLGNIEQNATHNFIAEIYILDTITNSFQISKFSFLNASFPPLNNTGKKGPIDGVLNQGTNMTTVFNLIPELPKGTFKFKIKIRDEDGNYSNWTETTPINLGTK